MNFWDLIGGGVKVPNAPGTRDRTPKRHPDPERSESWNAWREKQALHPRGVFRPIGTAAPKRELTAHQVRARRSSTRASRRRAARKAAA